MSFDSEPTERSYFITCRLKFYNKTVKEMGRSYDRKLCLLIPEESDQRTSFLNAWLPETRQEHFELAGIINPPIDSPCRFSIHRANEICEKHYLFVMTVGVEEDLVRMREGSLLRVKILPESGDTTVDQARDASDGNFHLIPGQESF